MTPGVAVVFWRDEDQELEEWWRDPWEVNPEWSGGQVIVRDHTLWLDLVRVVFLNAVFWTLAILAYRQGPQGALPEPLRLAVLLLPAVALVEAGRVLLKRRALAARDEVVLRIDGGTGVIGGELRGTLATGVPADQLAEPTLHVRLACYHVYPGANPRKNDAVPRPERIWQEEQEVPWSGPAGGVTVPVSFSIPPSLPESDTAFTEPDHVFWQLAASAPGAHPPYHVRMRVPVFRKQT